MNKKHCSLLTISILFACNAQSAGFQVAEHSASGLGRAFSGEGAVADNASVLARNPAAMTLLKKLSFQVRYPSSILKLTSTTLTTKNMQRRSSAANRSCWLLH